MDINEELQRYYEEYYKEWGRQYYQNNKEERIAYQKSRRKEARESEKKYAEKNKDKRTEYNRKYQKNNKEKQHEYYLRRKTMKNFKKEIINKLKELEIDIDYEEFVNNSIKFLKNLEQERKNKMEKLTIFEILNLKNEVLNYINDLSMEQKNIKEIMDDLDKIFEPIEQKTKQ